MTIRIAINGLGRIGRCLIRAVEEYKKWDVEIVAVNGPAPIETHVHLLKYDSVHGRFATEVKAGEGALIVGGRSIPLYHVRDLRELFWGKHEIDVVLECTGKFTKRADAAVHLEQGAKRVLISAPSSDAEATLVYGVNHVEYNPEHKVLSVGSCTTNCLAPVVKVLHETVGVEQGYMTTIHAYTGDQNLVDGSHKDLRRARAAALSMVPTSTGAAKALSQVLPVMKGRLDGTSIRVPVANVSMVDLTFTSEKDTDAETINAAMRKAAGGALQGVLGVCDEPLVSTDFTHDPHSAIFDLTATQVVGKRFCRVAAWYDNEWGFSCRMLDVAAMMK